MVNYFQTCSLYISTQKKTLSTPRPKNRVWLLIPKYTFRYFHFPLFPHDWLVDRVARSSYKFTKISSENPPRMPGNSPQNIAARDELPHLNPFSITLFSKFRSNIDVIFNMFSNKIIIIGSLRICHKRKDKSPLLNARDNFPSMEVDVTCFACYD